MLTRRHTLSHLATGAGLAVAALGTTGLLRRIQKGVGRNLAIPCLKHRSETFYDLYTDRSVILTKPGST